MNSTNNSKQTKKQPPEQLYVSDRDEWRKWLDEHHDKKSEIWLVYYKKHTSKPTIPYDDAVEEAICFGWIDSVVRKLDDEKYMQKFTPRKSKSNWSYLNKERARKMIKAGKMTDAGCEKIRELLEEDKNGLKVSKKETNKEAKKKLVIPPNVKKALSANKRASEYFNNLAPGYKRNYIEWILDAKREETRQRRLKELIKRLEENKKPGMK
ncbi:YdeI/OmpD-associated family protein [Methanolobus sp. WCC4]|uniref:YdeI/OmpD-associated family protein n=1 Tax=Methanolobus sp. WCC4 TaxID=3125784 RepID=UPI0030F7128A